MQNARLDEAQTGIKIAGRNINNVRYADNSTLMAESKEELNNLLVKVKEDSEKGRRKSQHSNSEGHGIQSHHFMANRQGNNWNSDRLYFLGLQNHCGWWHEIKRCWFLGRKAITNLDSVLRSRNIFVDKGPLNQSYGFSSSQVWMWELDHKEGWVLKNGCFWTVVLEKTLESPLEGDQTSHS